jgi:hypothetical protein
MSVIIILRVGLVQIFVVLLVMRIPVTIFLVLIDVLESDAERSETTSDLYQRHTE